jgi:hypothetical protein
MKMRYQETFELRDNDMRELSFAETNEVTGGTGAAAVSASSASGANSAMVVGISALLQTTNTFASAAIAAGISAVGPNNLVVLTAAAAVS